MKQDKKGVETYVKLALPEQWFLGADEELHDYVKNHVAQYGVMPDRKTLLNDLDISLPKTQEPPEYYADHLRKRYMQQIMKKNMLKAEKSLKEKDPDKAMSVFEKMFMDMTLTKHSAEIVDFKSQAYDIIHQDQVQKKLNPDYQGITSGWNYLDERMGGLVGGDLMSVVGRPAAGKTYLLLRMAHHAWKTGKIPMLFSMEMKPLPLMHRIVAMHTGVPVTKLKNAKLTTKMYKTKVKGVLQSVMDSNMPPFYIIDGNLAASVADIKMLARQLKPDSIYVDGAYLVSPKDAWVSAQPGAKIKDTCEGLKQEVAGDLNLPVTASYQLNRDQTKHKSKGNKNKTMQDEIQATGLEHIAGGDAIGQISSIVLGLFQEDSVETLIQKHVALLKGRSGESGGFDINWIFDNPPYMDFDQIEEENLEDLQFT